MTHPPINGQDDALPSGPRAFQIRWFEQGEEIVSEGAFSPGFAVVLEGTAGIIRKGQLVRTLEPQDHFGLESTLMRRALPYSAKAYSSCRIAFYEGEILDHFIEESPRMIRSVLTSAIKQLLETTENAVGSGETVVMDPVRVVFFARNDVIFREGTAGTEFFRLISTESGLSLSREGREFQRLEDPGQFLGDVTALMGLPRDCTATSMGESAMEVYDSGRLESIVRDHPDVTLHLIRNVLHRCSKSSPS